MGKSHKKKHKKLRGKERAMKLKFKEVKQLRQRLIDEAISDIRSLFDLESPNHSPERNKNILVAEQRQEREEYLRSIQGGDRLKLQMKNRNIDIDDLIDEATQKVKDFKMFRDHESENVSLKLKSNFTQVINAADVILEVLDARDPLGCRCPQVEEFALNNGKSLILVLNKIDLIPKDNLSEWLRYLRQEVPTIAFKASIESQNVYLSQSEDTVVRMGGSLLSSRCCVGASFLFNLLENYSRDQNTQTSIKVGVVGFPNVGKKSVIKSLKQFYFDGKATDLTNEVKSIEILDNPGVVYAKGDSPVTLALRNAVNVKDLKDVAAPAEAIVLKLDPKMLCLHYSVPKFSSCHDFLCSLAAKMSKFEKSGNSDSVSAARRLIDDWNNGNLKYYTHPPEKFIQSQYISTDYIVQMSQIFHISYEKELEELNKAPLLDPVVSIPATRSEPTECLVEKEMGVFNCTLPKVINWI